MKFSHSYSEAEPCLSGPTSQRNSQIVPSSSALSPQLLSQGSDSGEIPESDYSGPAAIANPGEIKKKCYSNTISHNEIQKLLSEAGVEPAFRLGIGPAKTNYSYANRKDQIESKVNNLKYFDPFTECP